MKCPEGMRVVSVMGREYRPDRNGIIEAPLEAESTLYSFGLLMLGKNLPEVQEPEPVQAEKRPARRARTSKKQG